MNSTFSLEQTSQTGNLDSKLLLHRYQFNQPALFLEIKSVNPTLRHDQIAKEIGCSSSTLQRYRNHIIMLSLFRFPSNSHKRREKISNREHDLERPQMTSNDLKRSQLISKESSPNIETGKPKKNKMKGGGNIEINEEYLDKSFHKINL